MNELKNLPGVDKLLCLSEIRSLVDKYGIELVTYSIRKTIDKYREQVKKGGKVPPNNEIVKQVEIQTLDISNRSLKPVINATGVIIHTNLGRSPFGEDLVNEVSEVLTGYNNLEFNLKDGSRGDRNHHASELLKYLTGAEDILVVNNNAAAVMFILSAFAKGKEVIISRGELIEIGGSFRIPEIMKASGCKMIEVGTTNRTRLKDYENSINKKTVLLFKAHKSNYMITGFTEEAGLAELVKLGKKHGIPVVFDLGTGLLKKIDNKALKNEPDVKQALATGVDLVCFSGDKLLGGPQAGIIAGKQDMINRLRNKPMMRALRVGKITLAYLENACLNYLNNKTLTEKNMLFNMLKRSKTGLKRNAEILQNELKKHNINTKIITGKGQYGGGTLPDLEIDSYSVVINEDMKTCKKRSDFAEDMYLGLLNHKTPVLGILKQGKIYFDLLTIFDKEIKVVAKAIVDVYSNYRKKQA